MRKIMELVAVAAFLAGPVAAQDLRFDMRVTLSCLDRAGIGEAAYLCVGESANACMSATSDGGTTVGMGGCLDAELSYWDDRLNASYRALRAAERSDDVEYGGSFGYVSKAEALVAMQRAWIPFRDATCDYERSQWGGGTGGGPATLSCLLRMTGVQALYLEQMAANY